MPISLTQRSTFWRARVAFALFTFVSVFILVFSSQPGIARADSLGIANEQFRATWDRTDFPIKDGKTSRSWYWGPAPFSADVSEDYADSPGGKRQVQYFDKARMEINNPATRVVTNGLLVVELINGRRQDGDNLFTNVGPAAIPVAGDNNNPWPTYASLGGVYLKAREAKTGDPVLNSWTPQGVATFETYKADPLNKIATKENNLGIPAAFWNFLNRKGPVYVNGSYSEATISEWLFSTGFPVTEAYWTRVKVGGAEKDVLFQAFERRLLTYTPSNPEGFKVEMGNVGLHYISWRYPLGLPKPVITPDPPPPVPAPFNVTHPEWYEVTGDVLNVRTAPNTQAPNPVRTETKPYLSQLYKGNRIQALRSVKGEEIEPGNNTWLQFYESPDMFVYSGYVKKMTLPDFPTPPQYHKGLWVSVSLSRQMLAVFQDNRLIYKTFISSGIPNDDPEKDYRTPTGVFKIDGSYRPASQTMEGGTSDKASGGDYYKIEEIRNVSYFFQDYAIHGSYWHARYGTVPQSHGCVNATVYDAGLVFKLKAGTLVEVFRASNVTSLRTDW